MLAGIDLGRARGVEIGALNKPLVTREEGSILYVDHADTETLRRKYADHPLVDTSQIVQVDAVWGENTLKEALGGITVDYVLASHLLEHVPDLLGWLEEVHAVLRPEGELRLALPDRRFTFDYLRRESTLADILYAKILRARVPQLPALLDHILEVSAVDLGQAWAGQIDRSALRRLHTLEHALGVAEDMQRNGTYHDVHCWVFTPRSFAALLERAAGLGLIKFRCTGFHDTRTGELDFTVHLRPCADPQQAAESWRAMADACADLPLKPVEDRGGALEPESHRLEGRDAARRNLEAELRYALEERDAARRELELLRNSTSWRLGAPLRQVVDRFRTSRIPG